MLCLVSYVDLHVPSPRRKGPVLRHCEVDKMDGGTRSIGVGLHALKRDITSPNDTKDDQ